MVGRQAFQEQQFTSHDMSKDNLLRKLRRQPEGSLTLPCKRRETLSPVPTLYLFTQCYYLQHTSAGNPTFFFPDKTGGRSLKHKQENLSTSHYKIDFLSPFHNDNQMKNMFSSDLVPRAL